MVVVVAVHNMFNLVQVMVETVAVAAVVCYETNEVVTVVMVVNYNEVPCKVLKEIKTLIAAVIPVHVIATVSVGVDEDYYEGVQACIVITVADDGGVHLLAQVETVVNP